jgi:tRNA-specific 2-thiouridylase
MFPLGEMTKTEVRAAVAHRFQGLAVLTKPESMGICFVGERSLPSFLGEYMNFTPGR